MSFIEVFLVDSFTKEGRGGNAAGVVFNAEGLTHADKLKIAKMVGFSETAFVCKDETVDFEVSFFTTTDEVNFCGHATVAAFSTLLDKGLIKPGRYIQRTKAGELEVTVTENAEVIMEQQLPEKLGCFSVDEIASVLGVETQVLEKTQLPIEVISTGLPDVIVPVPAGILDLIKPNNQRIADFCEQNQVVGFHLFELCESSSNLTASCRNFAPLYGITEESATGTSNGALACYLTEHLLGEGDFTFEQGRAMGCASIIRASIKTTDSNIVDVRVGGFANCKGALSVNLS